MNVDGLGSGFVKRSAVRLPSEGTSGKSAEKTGASENSRKLKDEVAVENRLSQMSTIRDVDDAKNLLNSTVREMMGNGKQALEAYRNASGVNLSGLIQG